MGPTNGSDSIASTPKPQGSGAEGSQTAEHSGGLVFDSWKLPKKKEAALGVPPLLGAILANRGISDPAAVAAYLEPNFARDVHDPFLFRDMKKTVDRINEAIKNKEKIIVHGDYDADGISAAALLFVTLQKLGAEVEVFLPDREMNGYGLNPESVVEFINKGVRLIITCDCGISDNEAIDRAAQSGVDVIVTDHHTIPPKLPEKALAIIHPLVEGETYPCQVLSGGGVAFKVAQALIRDNKEKVPAAEAFEKWLVDYVAVSSVADMVPLQEETRVLTYFGLKVLPKSQRPGMRFLSQGFEETITERTIGFYLAPHLNAAGRMENPMVAFHALVEKDPLKAYGFVQQLKALNQKRKSAVDGMMKEIHNQLQVTGGHEYPIVLAQGEWLPALAGLAANKLAKQYNKPAIVVAKGKQGFVGSGRSPQGVNLVEFLREREHLFERLGGHPAACGFTVKPEALQAFELELKEAKIEPAPRALTVDVLHPMELLTMDTVEQVKKLGPFGQGNPKPLFLSRVVPIAGSLVGSDASHMRLTVRAGDKIFKAIAFGLGPIFPKITMEKPAEIVYEIDINVWNGRTELQIQLMDIRQ